jgi:LacI family transcriptional regulator
MLRIDEVKRLRKATLSDVAARAGVSTTTASYILNGRSAQMRISHATEQRVRRAITELSYRPNRNARSLRTARTSTIGVITDFVASGIFSSQMLAGANRAARAADHLLVIGETEGDGAARDLLIDEMVDRQVDGIIYATRNALRVELPPLLRGPRVVTLNCYQPGGAVPAVLPDDHGGGCSAAQVLIDAGIDSQVYVVGDAPDGEGLAGPRRLAGIRETFQSHGADIAGMIECEWSPAAAYEAVGAWLARGHVPHAFICMNDRAALGAYEALDDRDLAVPDAVSVIGFDGSELASWIRPSLTSVALPLREMGARAVQLLLGEEPAEGDVELMPLTVERGDSVRAAAGHPDV